MESTLSLNLETPAALHSQAQIMLTVSEATAHLPLIDEFAYVQSLQSMWEASLLPMLSTTDGRVLFCSTPAGGGNFAAELWERAKNTPSWERWSFRSVVWVNQAFIDEAKCTMDPSLYRQEFEASIESLLGAIYPNFSCKDNVSPRITTQKNNY